MKVGSEEYNKLVVDVRDNNGDNSTWQNCERALLAAHAEVERLRGRPWRIPGFYNTEEYRHAVELAKLKLEEKVIQRDPCIDALARALLAAETECIPYLRQTYNQAHDRADKVEKQRDQLRAEVERLTEEVTRLESLNENDERAYEMRLAERQARVEAMETLCKLVLEDALASLGGKIPTGDELDEFEDIDRKKLIALANLASVEAAREIEKGKHET